MIVAPSIGFVRLTKRVMVVSIFANLLCTESFKTCFIVDADNIIDNFLPSFVIFCVVLFVITIYVMYITNAIARILHTPVC